MTTTPAAEEQHSCGGCGNVSTTLQRCHGCQSIYYCGRDCQRAHWTTHKKMCQSRPPPSFIIKPSNIPNSGFGVFALQPLKIGDPTGTYPQGIPRTLATFKGKPTKTGMVTRECHTYQLAETLFATQVPPAMIGVPLNARDHPFAPMINDAASLELFVKPPNSGFSPDDRKTWKFVGAQEAIRRLASYLASVRLCNVTNRPHPNQHQFLAILPINANDELTYHYGSTYWLEREDLGIVNTVIIQLAERHGEEKSLPVLISVFEDIEKKLQQSGSTTCDFAFFYLFMTAYLHTNCQRQMAFPASIDLNLLLIWDDLKTTVIAGLMEQ